LLCYSNYINNAPENSMNSKQAHKEAAKVSKTEGPRYVVYVFDEGQAVYTGQQVRIYAPLILIEALYVDGVCAATAEAAQAVARL
jgi:hypothetical protein